MIFVRVKNVGTLPVNEGRIMSTIIMVAESFLLTQATLSYCGLLMISLVAKLALFTPATPDPRQYYWSLDLKRDKK
jgi:predicted membrane chloride channel (bestrophin family)